MMIDARTLLEVAAVLSLLMGVLVLTLEWRLSQPMPGLRLWALASFAIGAGSACSALRGVVDAWIPIGLGIPLFLLGRVLQFAALRLFDGRSLNARLIAPAFVVAVAAIVLAHALRPDTLLRPLLVTAVGFVITAATAASAILGGPLSPARVVMSAGLSGLAAVNLWRASMVSDNGPLVIGSELQLPLIGLQVGVVLVMDVVTSVGMMLLISERMHDWVLQLSRHDHLTGALSRGALIAQATLELQRARRLQTRTAAFIVDIDQFKGINDVHGHPVGDRALQHVAEQGRRMLRCTDAFGRYGGDEFVAVLPDTDLLTAAAIAERLRLAVSETAVDRELPPLTVSIGAAAVEPGSAGLPELIAEADAALYNAKRAGRNRVAVATDAQGPANTSLRVLQGRR